MGRIYILLAGMSFLLALPTQAQQPATDTSSAAEQRLSKTQMEDITRIARQVTRGVLDIPSEQPPTAEQQALIERVTRTLVEDAQTFQVQQQREKAKKEERAELITSIVLNVAKGIAIIIALLVLRAIIGAIGRGVEMEAPETPIGVFIAANTEADAERIGRTLIEEHLAARGTLTPQIRSLFRVEEEILDKPKVLLTLKTIRGNLPPIIGRVEELQPDDVPEIIALPKSLISDPDLDWVKEPAGRKPEKKRWWPWGGKKG